MEMCPKTNMFLNNFRNYVEINNNNNNKYR